MSTKNVCKLILASVIAIASLVVLSLLQGLFTPANANTVLPLHPPPFVSVANAELALARSSIESEAGISAYFSAGTTINLNSVRGVFRTIENETSDYIIGSVPVANYPETEDVHVYVHKNGWVLAYYLTADPTGKIFDWRVYDSTGRISISTKLENTLAVVATAAGVPFSASNATCYDFRYPNATHLMLIVEWSNTGIDSFQVKLPGTFAYYERSWSLGYQEGADFVLNGATVYTTYGCSNGWGTNQGTLTVTHLPPDQFHTIALQLTCIGYRYAGLALVYRVP
ncbi:MAG: hypothetical protein FJ009_09210 [Chloroflexi bacterium]|nr:hypothetical protein [Chloroflexota bacterium]